MFGECMLRQWKHVCQTCDATTGDLSFLLFLMALCRYAGQNRFHKIDSTNINKLASPCKKTWVNWEIPRISKWMTLCLPKPSSSLRRQIFWVQNEMREPKPIHSFWSQAAGRSSPLVPNYHEGTKMAKCSWTLPRFGDGDACKCAGPDRMPFVSHGVAASHESSQFSSDSGATCNSFLGRGNAQCWPKDPLEKNWVRRQVWLMLSRAMISIQASPITTLTGERGSPHLRTSRSDASWLRLDDQGPKGFRPFDPTLPIAWINNMTVFNTPVHAVAWQWVCSFWVPIYGVYSILPYQMASSSWCCRCSFP